MATGSPTPAYAGGVRGVSRHPSTRFVRRDSPPQTHMSGSTTLVSQQQIADESDDDLQALPQISDLGRSFLEQKQDARSTSPRLHSKMARTTRTTRTVAPESHTPARDTTTPAAPSQRVRRVGLQGAPVRRGKRTPQSEEDQGTDERPSQTEDHDDIPASQNHRHDHPPEEDQENAPASTMRRSDSVSKKRTESAQKPVNPLNSVTKSEPEKRQVQVPIRDKNEKAVALAALSSNTPHRPAPPPPPKMSVLEAATKAAGASTTKKKPRKFTTLTLNGKTYTQYERCGKGGSAEVHKVVAENGKPFALKKVKLAGADAMAVQGYKGEIEILERLRDVSRVVRLYDHHMDEEKQMLYVLMELGEGDLAKVLSNKLETSSAESSTDNLEQPALDFAFIRYWWKEMCACVKAVHDKDIVHTDLKPANFLVVKGALKLIDFGIAGAIDVEQTVNMYRDTHVGTPNFMSPESLQDGSITSTGASSSHPQIGRSMKLGKPSDIWSLGCILYNMVYGQPPFGSIMPAMSKVLAIINPAVVIEFPATGLGGTPVPNELRKTIKRCLQRDPSKRPTLTQLLSESDEWMHPESNKDLRISEQLLDQIIRRVAERFENKTKPPPTEEEIAQYAASFYTRIRGWES